MLSCVVHSVSQNLTKWSLTCSPSHVSVSSIGFLTKFRFAKISRNWLQNDFCVSRKWGTSFASFAVSRNCRDYERNEFRETWNSRKRRKLEVKIQNLTILMKMPQKSSLVIANWFCEESRKSKPNHHVNTRYRVDTKRRFQFFTKYNYHFLLMWLSRLSQLFCFSDNRYFRLIARYFA